MCLGTGSWFFFSNLHFPAIVHVHLAAKVSYNSVPYTFFSQGLLLVTFRLFLHKYFAYSIACGTWQFSLHNDEPCGFVTFLRVSVATHVTARGVHVITMKRRIRFGSVRE